MMTGFQAEENLTGRAQKNVRKILDVIVNSEDERELSGIVRAYGGVSGTEVHRGP